MTTIRSSSVQEYAAWYLAREANKIGATSSHRADDQAVTEMSSLHQGKMRPWFDSPNTKWSLACLDRLSDLGRLVFLESEWTKREGLVLTDGSPDYRILQRVAQNAMAVDYMSRPDAARHRKYFDAIRAGQLRLQGNDRIALCSAARNERAVNPSARFYLLDGVGRLLPLMKLLLSEQVSFEPVECFLAEEGP